MASQTQLGPEGLGPSRRLRRRDGMDALLETARGNGSGRQLGARREGQVPAEGAGRAPGAGAAGRCLTASTTARSVTAVRVHRVAHPLTCPPTRTGFRDLCHSSRAAAADRPAQGPGTRSPTGGAAAAPTATLAAVARPARRGRRHIPASVAQGIEHSSPKAGVAGSNPAGGTYASELTWRFPSRKALRPPASLDGVESAARGGMSASPCFGSASACRTMSACHSTLCAP